MKLPHDISRSKSLTHDQLLAQLREQAGLIPSEFPAGMHRRIATALAALEPAPKPIWASAAARWISLSAAGMVVGVIVAVAVMRSGSTTPVPQPEIAKKIEKPSPNSLIAPTPVALVQQWVDNPLEGELRDLLDDVSRATETVTSVLPAARKAGVRAGDAGV